MARRPYAIMGALNVVATPHPAGTYIRLLEAMRDHHVRTRGDEYAMIGTMANGGGRGRPNVRYGYLFFYTQIDKDGAWLDLSSKGVATSEAVEAVNIPENLRPNMRQMRYIFDPERHSFYFEIRNDKAQFFPAGKVKKILEKLVEIVLTEQPDIPDVRITVVPQHDAIDKVLRIPFLNRLYIRLERPNPDDDGDKARAILDELESQNASREEITLVKSKDAASLVPNERTKMVARVAAENGFARGDGTDADGRKIKAQTTDYPKEEPPRCCEWVA